MAAKFRQDMPPPGGYGPIEWAKQVPKRGLTGYKLIGGFLGVTVVGWGFYYLEVRTKVARRLENRDGRNALEPLLEAEMQRAFMRQLRTNRDEENDLMKDVPGWETGKIDGEPVYWNQGKRFHIVNPQEYFAHNRWWDMYDRLTEKRKH